MMSSDQQTEMRKFPVKIVGRISLSLFCSYTGYIEHFILILRKFTAHIDKGSVGEEM